MWSSLAHSSWRNSANSWAQKLGNYFLNCAAVHFLSPTKILRVQDSLPNKEAGGILLKAKYQLPEPRTSPLLETTCCGSSGLPLGSGLYSLQSNIFLAFWSLPLSSRFSIICTHQYLKIWHPNHSYCPHCRKYLVWCQKGEKLTNMLVVPVFLTLFLQPNAPLNEIYKNHPLKRALGEEITASSRHIIPGIICLVCFPTSLELKH